MAMLHTSHPRASIRYSGQRHTLGIWKFISPWCSSASSAPGNVEKTNSRTSSVTTNRCRKVQWTKPMPPFSPYDPHCTCPLYRTPSQSTLNSIGTLCLSLSPFTRTPAPRLLYRIAIERYSRLSLYCSPHSFRPHPPVDWPGGILTMAVKPWPNLSFKCCREPTHRSRPPTMMVSRVHSASHSSIECDVSTTHRPSLVICN